MDDPLGLKPYTTQTRDHEKSWPFVEVERKKIKQRVRAAHLPSSSVKEWFCLTPPEIYDVDEVFTEVKAAHFPNQFVKHLLISRGFFINHKKRRNTLKMIRNKDRLYDISIFTSLLGIQLLKR